MSSRMTFANPSITPWNLHDFFGFVQSVILEQIQGEKVQSNPMDMDWYGEHMGTPTLWNGDLQWIYPAIKFGGSFQFVFWDCLQ